MDRRTDRLYTEFFLHYLVSEGEVKEKGSYRKVRWRKVNNIHILSLKTDAKTDMNTFRAAILLKNVKISIENLLI